MSTQKRKTHRKSRLGCTQCKERHAKCDEGRPSCSNCNTADRQCSYLATVPQNGKIFARERRMSLSTPLARSNTPLTPSSALSAQITPTISGCDVGTISGLSGAWKSSQYDMRHLVALHHLDTVLGKLPDNVILANEAGGELHTEYVFACAVSAPYLMDELLAISAVHLSTLQDDPVSKSTYFYLANELQSRALTQFNEAVTDIREDNCAALFMFSYMIGMHTLYNAAFHPEISNGVLDGFIQFLIVQRGERTITSQKWDIISHTSLKPVIDLLEGGYGQAYIDDTIIGYNRLACYITNSSDTIPSGIGKCYTDVIQALQQLYARYQRQSKPATVFSILSWAHNLPFEYIELLKQRRPEALVILAHWAILLHRERDFWMYGPAGSLLIECIVGHLGPFWDEWMVLPREALAEAQDV